ncbi:MAG: hypothetical protein QW520_04740 [Methanomassiliicoccales archaeon]
MTATSTAATTSAITLTSAVTLGIGGALVAVLLILLLSGRELVMASSKKSKRALSSLDAVIMPLFLAFVMSVTFQVLQVITPFA